MGTSYSLEQSKAANSILHNFKNISKVPGQEKEYYIDKYTVQWVPY